MFTFKNFERERGGGSKLLVHWMLLDLARYNESKILNVKKKKSKKFFFLNEINMIFSFDLQYGQL